MLERSGAGPRPGAKARAILIADPLIVLATVVFGTASLAVSFFDKTGALQHRLARIWGRVLMWAGGLKIKVTGLEKLDPRSTYVLAANHLSLLDPPLLLACLPIQFRFFAKEGLFKIPFIGGHLKRAGHLPVARENPRAGLRLLSEGARLIRERGTSVLIFPEGGRTEGTLREFLEGAAYVAIKAGVPVVPVGIAGTRESLPMGSLLVLPAHVRLAVGDPISTEGMTLHDRGRLNDLLQERVRELI